MRGTVRMLRTLAVGVAISMVAGLPAVGEVKGLPPSVFGAPAPEPGGPIGNLLSTVRAMIERVVALANTAGPDVGRTRVPANDRARGLVFDGLRPSGPSGLCRGGYEIELADGRVLCTHGPDPAPTGVDVRTDSPVLSAETGAATGAATAGSVTCIGDGVSGNRVQAVYAVASDRIDRYSEVRAQIGGWAGEVERVFAESAVRAGGERHVRFVTNPDCTLLVAHVVVSPTGDDNIMNTINELVAAGYGRTDRKYLVWMDAAVYCGIAQIFSDDRPGQDNLSNVRAGFARVDQGCWGGSYSSEAHELVHSLGGVQKSAPHASANFHCTDEEDRMCYKDGVDVVLTYDCPLEQGRYLDCNNDDYFHPNPPAGSYLATHWNVASSSFLEAGPVGSPPPPPPPANQAPTISAGPDLTVELVAGATLNGTASDDGLPAGTLISRWSKVSGPGEVSFTNAASPSTSAAFSAVGEYVLELSGNDGALVATDIATVTVIASSPPSGPVTVVDVFDSSLTRRFPARSHQVTSATGPATANLTFATSGKSKGGSATAGGLTLNLYLSDGTRVATATGPSGLSLSVDLPAGVSRFEVTGDLRVAYHLEVSHLAP